MTPMQPPSTSIFFITYFYRTGGAWPLAPPPDPLLRVDAESDVMGQVMFCKQCKWCRDFDAYIIMYLNLTNQIYSILMLMLNDVNIYLMSIVHKTSPVPLDYFFGSTLLNKFPNTLLRMSSWCKQYQMCWLKLLYQTSIIFNIHTERLYMTEKHWPGGR